MLNGGGSRLAGWVAFFVGLAAVFEAALDEGAIKTPPRPRRIIAIEVASFLLVVRDLIGQDRARCRVDDLDRKGQGWIERRGSMAQPLPA